MKPLGVSVIITKTWLFFACLAITKLHDQDFLIKLLSSLHQRSMYNLEQPSLAGCIVLTLPLQFSKGSLVQTRYGFL